MRHPTRSIRRTVRTRKPRHPRRESQELERTDWPDSIRVEERMNPAPLTTRPTAKVAEAARLMRESRIRHLPVLDGSNRLVGIVTDRDLLAYLASTRRFDERFLRFPEDLRFTGDVRAVPEGTAVFPDEPLLEVTAPIIEVQLVETAARSAISSPARALAPCGAPSSPTPRSR
jgi:CBS domain-containing protein